jgi:Glu-tRNA(Gln) amidotransferase subunit E-like FAD-binding protein
MGAIGPLMGIVMGQAQGVDGKEVSAILREIIQQHI